MAGAEGGTWAEGGAGAGAGCPPLPPPPPPPAPPAGSAAAAAAALPAWPGPGLRPPFPGRFPCRALRPGAAPAPL